MQNKISFIFFLLVFTSCSTPKQKEKYTYPISNPYPALFTTIQYSNGELLKTEIKSRTIEFSCTERNDQPYYWCGIYADFSNPVEGLPKKLDTIFHVQLPKWAVNNVKKIFQRYKKTDHNMTVIMHRDPWTNKERDSIVNQQFAFYDDKFCVAFLELEDELCPKKSKIINIYKK